MNNSKTNVFISFDYKVSNEYKEKLISLLKAKNIAIDYSEKKDRSKFSDETIWKELKKHISGSSVMIVLYSKSLLAGSGGKGCKVKDKYKNQSNKTDFSKEGWVYKEIKCALRSEKDNYMNGVMVLVPDDLWGFVFEQNLCKECRAETIMLKKENMVKIIYQNHFNVKPLYKTSKCSGHYDAEHDSYILIIKNSDFETKAKDYIELVKGKRKNQENYNIVKNEK